MKALPKVIGLALLSLALAGCGMDGLYSPSVIGGDEALDRLSDAAYAGYSACLQRTNPSSIASADAVALLLAGQAVQRGYLKDFYGIDESRGYKSADVDDCATQTVQLLALQSTCAIAPPKCYLAPVDRYTGN
ncbi:MAG: TIGR04452 family lipoprotein [Leptospirales bacterium]|nr:TIGR04452 family lipoprotein [Leptospirales bacterium]